MNNFVDNYIDVDYLQVYAMGRLNIREVREMVKDKLVRFCSGCGELEYYGHPLPYHVRVPEHKYSIGRVPGYNLYACSLACKDKIKAGVAADEAAEAQYLQTGSLS